MPLRQSDCHPLVWRLTGGDYPTEEAALALCAELRSLLRRGLVLSEAEQLEIASAALSSARIPSGRGVARELFELAYQAAAHEGLAASLPASWALTHPRT